MPVKARLRDIRKLTAHFGDGGALVQDEILKDTQSCRVHHGFRIHAKGPL